MEAGVFAPKVHPVCGGCGGSRWGSCRTEKRGFLADGHCEFDVRPTSGFWHVGMAERFGPFDGQTCIETFSGSVGRRKFRRGAIGHAGYERLLIQEVGIGMSAAERLNLGSW